MKKSKFKSFNNIKKTTKSAVNVIKNKIQDEN